MSFKVYKDHILEPNIKPWLDSSADFVLEEDRDSGLGTGKGNVVHTLKATHRLESYFNYYNYPNSLPNENW
jgi:hypothetical protein